MRALLDVSVLLALLDTDHVNHRRSRDWLSRNIDDGWASCAITQNGFVRIISQASYPSPVSPSVAISLLGDAASTEHHEFWPSSVSLVDAGCINPFRIHGPRQVTDVYLLALAVARGGRFVTLDGRIPLAAVPNATPDNLVVV